MNKLKVTETDLARSVEDLLTRFGWRWCHFRPARTQRGWRTALSGHSGFPDYVAVQFKDEVYKSSCRVLFIELKSEIGEISDEQKIWLNLLQLSPNEVYIWKPSDFEEIVRTLQFPKD